LLRFSSIGLDPLFAVAMGPHIYAGWLVAVAVQPTGTRLINTLTAFLGGAILMNVFIDEPPAERHSGFGWFVAVWSPTRSC
jgi:hypothetical protein